MELFDKYPVASGLVAFAFLVIFIVILLFFTKVLCPQFGFKCSYTKTPPAYTTDQQIMADKLWCKEKCL
jgi:hypothetical protein